MMHKTQPPRADQACMLFFLKNKYIYAGLNARRTVISYVTKLYIPIAPRQKNHKASAGANVIPTLLVPNCCMLNNNTRIMTETRTTASANKNKKTVAHLSKMSSSVDTHILMQCQRKQLIENCPILESIG